MFSWDDYSLRSSPSIVGRAKRLKGLNGIPVVGDRRTKERPLTESAELESASGMFWTRRLSGIATIHAVPEFVCRRPRLERPGRSPKLARWPSLALCGRLSVGKGFFRSSVRLGRCGRVFDLLMRHTYAAGHNAFREGGSRSKARARGAGPKLGFPAFRFDRLSHYFMFALTNFVSAALACACFYAVTGSR